MAEVGGLGFLTHSERRMLQSRFSVSTSTFIAIDEPIKGAINNGLTCPIKRLLQREKEESEKR